CSFSLLCSSSCLRRFCFFFSCSPPPRHLHSFPTRRSSDLIAEKAACRLLSESMRKFACVTTFSPGCTFVTAIWRSPLSNAPRPRSEEHTSELQSRFDLVCRLLLEKKKHNIHQTYTETHIQH